MEDYTLQSLQSQTERQKTKLWLFFACLFFPYFLLKLKKKRNSGQLMTFYAKKKSTSSFYKEEIYRNKFDCYRISSESRNF